jgi:N-acetylglucosaminyldiphosphoundecaprenol N-acetyl-beta-D-mannosaminyltransferase
VTLPDLASIRLFGMNIHVVSAADALDRVRQWTLEPFVEVRYVVTPNVQHAMLFQEHAAFREAYSGASLVIADGWPLVATSWLFGKHLPERVAGSDLLPGLFAMARADQPLSTFLLGAAPGVGQRAAAVIAERWPHVRVVGTYSPPLGFEADAAENERILQMVRQAAPDVLVVGLGAPKQELWSYRFRGEIHAKVALCLGGTIDFIAGNRPRAPRWMQKTGLEWLHRAASEPRRLGPRYAEHAIMFPGLLLREWRESSRGRRRA